MAILINYVYIDTKNKTTKPKGDGWEYWSDRVLLNEQGQEIERVAVWRRGADVYGYVEPQE